MCSSPATLNTAGQSRARLLSGGCREEERGGGFTLLLLLSACRTVAQADVVFLVDESWSVGPSGFSRVKDFVSAIITSFKDSVVGSEGVRFGVTVFGDVPK